MNFEREFDNDNTALKNYEVTVTAGNAKVKQAELSIALDEVRHVYGSPAELSAYSGTVTGLANGDQHKVYALTRAEDAALKDNNQKTEDARLASYGWSASLTGIDKLDKNYVITGNAGNSYVDKADLKISIGNVETVYGTAFDTTKYGYTIDGHANGDTDAAIRNLIGAVSYNNTGV